MSARGFVVTGASKGLGAALVDRLVEAGEHVVAVQRSAPAPRAGAAPGAGRAETLACDLADVADVGRLAARLAERVVPRFDSLVLISNAGVIGPIRQVGELGDAGPVVDHVTVNYLAPMLIVDAVVSALAAGAHLDVVNISSGAAGRPIPGWSLYCSSKSALKAYLDVLDVENDRVTVVHVDPGVMDTGMQETIRAAGVRDFPGVQRFRAYQADGRLRSADEVARGILERYLGS